MNYAAFLNTAIKAAKAGGEVIARGFEAKKDITMKRFADPVTEFDKESEETIVGILTEAYPKHSILAEEGSQKDEGHALRWIIDPLDGTVNFTHRIPFVCTTLGLESDGEMVVGVIYNPILDELYTAVKGQGAYLNGTRIHVSEVSDVAAAMVITGFPYEREGRMQHLIAPLQSLIRDYEGFRRLGSAAMDMGYLACGKCDIFYEENLKPWDTAGGAVIVEEAGGKITNYYGEKFDPYQKTILATNSTELHNEMLKLTEGIRDPKFDFDD